MITIRTMSFCVAISLLIAAVGFSSTVHVCPTGNDSGDGTLDAPFATLNRARDFVRVKRKAGELDDGPIFINLHAGAYLVTETLNLTAEDSGTPDSPVIWQAAPGEDVRLVGGARLTGWKPVSEKSMLTRLPAEARGHVFHADLTACGVTDFGTVKPGATRAELFFGNRYMRLARYPNEGAGKQSASASHQQAPCIFQHNFS